MVERFKDILFILESKMVELNQNEMPKQLNCPDAL